MYKPIETHHVHDKCSINSLDDPITTGSQIQTYGHLCITTAFIINVHLERNVMEYLLSLNVSPCTALVYVWLNSNVELNSFSKSCLGYFNPRRPRGVGAPPP